MLDRHVLEASKQFQLKLAPPLISKGVQADQITVAGFLIGITVIPLLAMKLYWLAFIVILLNRLFDGLDGTIARLTKTTDRGGFLDITLDFIFYSAVPIGFALANSQVNALPAAILIYSFIATGTSFLAFAIVAEKRKLKSTDYPNKGFYYLGGLAEATETISVFLLMCLFPSWFPVLAIGFAAICFFSAGLRIHAGWKAFQ